MLNLKNFLQLMLYVDHNYISIKLSFPWIISYRNDFYQHVFTQPLPHGQDVTQGYFLSRESKCSPMVRETGVQSQVESYQRLKKWYLMSPCLTLSIIR